MLEEVVKKKFKMDLELYPNNGSPIIEGYGNGYVNISGNKFIKTFILFPDTLEELNNNSIKEIAKVINSYKNNLDLIIFGSPAKLSNNKEYIDLKLAITIPIEFMHTYSACRTWSVLIAEGRNVGAIIEPTKIDN